MKIRIGTRGSSLALIQTRLTMDALSAQNPNLEMEVVPITTTGDMRQGTALAGQGDKKEWILEIEQALTSGEIDIAVHSAKDAPVDTAPGSQLIPILDRAEPYDVLLSKSGIKLAALPAGAKVAVSSIRRRAQLRAIRPDLDLTAVRGNVPTRVRKLETVDAMILAHAGLERLALDALITETLRPPVFVPAVNQGILVSQVMNDRTDLYELLNPLVRDHVRLSFLAERAVIAALGADCHSAVGVFAVVEGASLCLETQVLMPDGSSQLHESRSVECRLGVDGAEILGKEMAESLLKKGARAMLGAALSF